ncbi:ABC transporter permease [Haloferax sp. DFSO60]|uniref:ABC transporter permease n=1 Tax=Haloferax sp. DFSO60 TaxID=3388652 RepID=UPI003978F25F
MELTTISLFGANTLTPLQGGFSMELILLQLLNGLALGVLYVLLASGMSVIFGITDILNFAHGAFYMVGAYLALVVIGATGSFFVALFLAPIGVALIGAGLERATLNRIYDRGPLYHVLLTFGLVLIITDAVEFIWGGGQQLINTPEILSGAVQLGPIFYPKYRLFTILAGGLLAIATWLLFRYTKFGLIVRAGAQDQQTVRVMGVDMAKYFTLVFALGSLLAGAAGVLAAPFLNVNPSMGNEILVIAFIVVAVGGLGSYLGSVVAALIIGMLQTIGNVLVPELSGFLIYLIMFGILLFRPQGILGSYEIRDEVAKLSFDETINPIPLTDRRVLALLGLLVLVPLGVHRVFSPYVLGLISLMFIWGLFALSLDIVMGYIGLISFGHAAFFGVGAYAVGLTTIHVTNSFVLALLVAVLVTTVLAWVIGALSIRLTGVYFAMITFASAQLLYQLSFTIPELTGGSNGLTGIPDIRLFQVIDLANPIAFYYLALVCLAACYFLAVRVMDSPFGRVLTAIRESERRASFLGYDANKYKRRAFAFSGAVGGVAGALFVTYQTFVSPNTLYWFVSGDALFAMVLGGTGTLYGPIIGGAVLVGLDHVLSTYTEQWRFVLGLFLVLTVLFAPRGLVSIGISVRERIDAQRTTSTPATEETVSGENQ